MTFRITILFSALACLVLPACGGGGGTDAVDPVSLNPAEKQLAGTYELQDFTVFEAGTPPCSPSDFDTWHGSMELREDGTARLEMQFCEHEGLVSQECAREFLWTADAGLLHLVSVDPEQNDVLVHWATEGMGGIRTESVLPSNDPNCGLLLADDGFETFYWLRLP